MKLQRRFHQLWVGLAVLALAACAPPAAQTLPAENTAVPTPVEAGTQPASAASLAAQEWLASQLGIPVEEVTLVSEEHTEWSDSCLGLGQPDEGCAVMVVPGWLVTLSAEGQTYALHTDETGADVRLAPPAVASELSDTDWELVAFDANGVTTSVVVPGSITLTFQADGRAGGSGGCNSFSGLYRTQDGSLLFGSIASTLMACADPDLMGQEQQFHEALQNASSYTLEGETLTITHAGGALTFKPLAVESAAWPRQQFGEAWDVAFPEGWAVNDAGQHEGAIQLEGPWEQHTYRVNLTFPIGLTAETLEAWVEEQLAPLTEEERALVEQRDVIVAGVPGTLLLNMPAAGETSPMHNVYVWRSESQNPRLISLTQQDGQAFDAQAAAEFLDRFMAQVQAPVTTTAEARLPGILDFYADGTEGVLTAPDTVQAGEEFEITLSTFGSGCERAGDTSVVTTLAGAEVMVYDFSSATGPETVCTDILNRLPHNVTLRFDQPGEMIIRVWGRRVGPENAGLGVPTLIEHTVTVQGS